MNPRDIQRQRKIVEGELRNNYFRESSPLKKHIEEIEADLIKLEAEFRDLETYFSSPESYGDTSEIKDRTIRYHELRPIISGLTKEWEQLSLDYEQRKQAFEQAKKDLADQYSSD